MALSVMYWNNYVNGVTKLGRKSENAVNCNRVLRFIYDSELEYVTGNVQASMRDRTYKVEVSDCNNLCV